MTKNKRKILVTGGAGFIGHHLCTALVANGDDVVILDDLSTGQVSNVPDGTHLVRGDIRREKDVKQAMQGCDFVVHLAAIASVMVYNDDWHNASSVNLGGTICVFQAAADMGIPVVYASSAAVYGAANDLPLKEDSKLVPISGYGADKLACELQARAMAEVHGLASVGLRFFNIYGPGQMRGSAYSGVITNFLDRWQAHEPLTIYGDGTQSRDFIYVGDIVTAIRCAMARATAGGAQILNICSGHSTTINELVNMLERATDHSFAKSNLGARDGEILHSLGDATLAAADMDFRAETGLQDGLRALVEWFARQSS